MTTSNPHGLSPSTVETVAGLTAGLASTIVVHPLDIIKTRLQVDNSKHPLLNSSRSVLRDLLRNEGPTRIAALYRGLTPNIIGNSAGWSLYFLWYKQSQDAVRSFRGYAPDTRLTSVDYLVASATAGALSSLVTNPIWVIKTRMLTTSATQVGAYSGLVSGLRSLYQKEGIRGFSHGLVPTLAGVSHGAIYFAVYEKLKQWRKDQRKSDILTNTDTLLTSSLSKVLAGSITYPHQVVRARLQVYDPAATVQVQGPGVIGVIRNLWRAEGFLGFYKGLFPNLLRVVPSTCVTFLVYENTRWWLPRFFASDEEKTNERKSAL